MLSAPAVTYPTGRTRQLAALLLALWLLGAASGLWMTVAGLSQPQMLWQAGVVGFAVILTGLALLWFWRALRPRRLAWDGAQWRLILSDATLTEGPAVHVQVRLDLQRALLLRVNDVGAGCGGWLWAQAGRDQANWHLLRCALYRENSAAQSTRDAVDAMRV